MLKTNFLSILVLVSFESLLGELIRNGTNVCSSQIEIMPYDELIVRKAQCKQIKEHAVHFECVENLKKDRYQYVYYCCDGYVEREGNCGTACEKGMFGFECNQKCRCDQNNTIKCHNETGRCLCKRNYWGVECECTGTSDCEFDSTNWICEETLRRRINEIKMRKQNDLGRVSEEMEKHSELILQNQKQTRDVLIAVLVCISVISIIFCTLAFRYCIKYRDRARRLEYELKHATIGC